MLLNYFSSSPRCLLFSCCFLSLTHSLPYSVFFSSSPATCHFEFPFHPHFTFRLLSLRPPPLFLSPLSSLACALWCFHHIKPRKHWVSWAEGDTCQMSLWASEWGCMWNCDNNPTIPNMEKQYTNNLLLASCCKDIWQLITRFPVYLQH